MISGKSRLVIWPDDLDTWLKTHGSFSWDPKDRATWDPEMDIPWLIHWGDPITTYDTWEPILQ